jgi:diguanylate cyclase (GGDEF)-like protein
MAVIVDQERSLDPISMSVRDQAAEERDREAEERDAAAQARDGLIADGTGEGSIQRALAAMDRINARRDRAQAARDRESARHDLAYAGIDPLTGAMGRGVGLAAIRREMDRAERTGERLVLAYVDAVGLKAINDTSGHTVGDRLLEDIATSLKQDLRPYDLVARVGGDEFVCTHLGQGIDQIAVRYSLLSHHLATKAGGAKMTVGLAALQPGDSLRELVERADLAMIAGRR